MINVLVIDWDDTIMPSSMLFATKQKNQNDNQYKC